METNLYDLVEPFAIEFTNGNIDFATFTEYCCNILQFYIEAAIERSKI
jgi:hypothetical protein